MKPARSESRNVDGVGDLLRAAEPPGRHQRLELLAVAVAVEVGAGQVGLDVARADRVDGHAVGRPLARHDPHHLVDPALGRGVRRVVRVGEQGRDRGHEGHPAVAGGHHAPADLLAEPPGGGQVEGEDRLPVVVAELEHRPPVVAARRRAGTARACRRSGGLLDGRPGSTRACSRRRRGSRPGRPRPWPRGPRARGAPRRRRRRPPARPAPPGSRRWRRRARRPRPPAPVAPRAPASRSCATSNLILTSRKSFSSNVDEVRGPVQARRSPPEAGSLPRLAPPRTPSRQKGAGCPRSAPAPAAAATARERPHRQGRARSPADKPEYRVEALAKGLRLLSLFDEQRPSWRVTDLAAAAGLPVPTVYRVVMTLTAEGYLDHLPNGDYRPGVKTLTLGTAALRSLDLVGLATPAAAAPGRDHRGDGQPRGAHRRPGALPRPAAQLRPGDGQHPGRLDAARRHDVDRQAAAGLPRRRRAAPNA